LRAERRRSEIPRLDLRIEEDLPGNDDQRDREDAPEGAPEYRVGAVET